MKDTPTPRTAKLYKDYTLDPYKDTGDLAAIMHIQCERFERELTEVTEHRDRLLEEREQWSLSSAFKEIDMMGIRYAAAEMHHANNMKEVTEQRDRLAKALERILDYQGRFAEEDPESIAREALKSLIPNK